MARRPLDEFLIIDIETVPDTARWTRPSRPYGEGRPERGSPPIEPPVAPVERVGSQPISGMASQPIAVEESQVVESRPVEAAARVASGPVAVGHDRSPVHDPSPGHDPPLHERSPERTQTITDAPPFDRASRSGRRDDSFPPTWAHRVVVIGVLWLDHSYRLKRLDVLRGKPSTETSSEDARERALLHEFSRLVGTARPILVTYNGRAFDMPVMALRALCHAVPMPWYYRDRNVRYRYSEEGHLDLCDWLADHGAARAGKLDAVARLIGLPGKVGVDGSQVEGLYAEGRLADVESYCLADVAQTALLFLRFRLLQGHVSPALYRERTAELVDALAADRRIAEVLAGLDRDQLLGPPLDDDERDEPSSATDAGGAFVEA